MLRQMILLSGVAAMALAQGQSGDTQSSKSSSQKSTQMTSGKKARAKTTTAPPKGPDAAGAPPIGSAPPLPEGPHVSGGKGSAQSTKGTHPPAQKP